MKGNRKSKRNMSDGEVEGWAEKTSRRRRERSLLRLFKRSCQRGHVLPQSRQETRVKRGKVGRGERDWGNERKPPQTIMGPSGASGQEQNEKWHRNWIRNGRSNQEGQSVREDEEEWRGTHKRVQLTNYGRKGQRKQQPVLRSWIFRLYYTDDLKLNSHSRKFVCIKCLNGSELKLTAADSDDDGSNTFKPEQWSNKPAWKFKRAGLSLTHLPAVRRFSASGGTRIKSSLNP